MSRLVQFQAKYENDTLEAEEKNVDVAVCDSLGDSIDSEGSDIVKNVTECVKALNITVEPTYIPLKSESDEALKYFEAIKKNSTECIEELKSPVDRAKAISCVESVSEISSSLSRCLFSMKTNIMKTLT